MKNRTPEQAKKHREYMKEYYRKNDEKRKKNTEKSNKRGLEKIPCTECEKYITRVNMKRHINNIHSEYEIQDGLILFENLLKTKNGILLNKE